MERQSAPCKKFVTSVVPSEMAPNMTARWEMDIKYGKVCHNLSYHIVGSRQDAEECVNDAYTLYCREWLQFLILLVEEFGCFLLITAGTVIVEAVEWFSGWIAEL